MKRSGFTSKFPRREPTQSTYTTRPREVAVARPDAVARCSAPVLKVQGRVSQAIRDSARGEECSVRLVGVCNNDPATTVWSHLPGIDGDRGMGIKSLDLCGAACCSACHDVIDGRAPLPAGATRQSVMLDWMFGHMRSLVRLAQKGLL